MRTGNRRIANFFATILYRVCLVLCHFSDSTVARMAAAVAKWGKKRNADPDMVANLEDIAKIFQAGPPGSEIARRMVREARPHRSSHADGRRPRPPRSIANLSR